MKRICLALAVVLFAATSLFAQEFSKEDKEELDLAIEYSDNGNANKAIDRGYEYYRRMGYSEAWSQRIMPKPCMIQRL